jgi:hypothetical protein
MLGLPDVRHLPRDLSVGRDVEALAGIPSKYGALVGYAGYQLLFQGFLT